MTIARRIFGAVPVLLGISFLVFLLMHLAPGDPVTLLLGDDATPADVARVRHEWGLDQPLLTHTGNLSPARWSAISGNPSNLANR